MQLRCRLGLIAVTCVAGAAVKAGAAIRHQTLAPGQPIAIKTGSGPQGHRFPIDVPQLNRLFKTPTTQSPLKIYVHSGKVAKWVSRIFEEDPKRPYLFSSRLAQEDMAQASRIFDHRLLLGPDERFQILKLGPGTFVVMLVDQATSPGTSTPSPMVPYSSREEREAPAQVTIEGHSSFVQPLSKEFVPGVYGNRGTWMAGKRPMAFHVLAEGLGEYGALAAALAGGIVMNPPVPWYLLLQEPTYGQARLKVRVETANQEFQLQSKSWQRDLVASVAAAIVTEDEFHFANVGDISILQATSRGEIQDLTGLSTADAPGFGTKNGRLGITMEKNALKLAPQDLLVMATKELRGHLTDTDILEILGKSKSDTDAEKKLVSSASKRLRPGDPSRALGAKVISRAKPVALDVWGFRD